MPFVFTLSRRQKLIGWLVPLALAVLGAGYWYSSRPDTPGERFDAYIEKMTAFCKNYRPSPGDVTCEFLKLKPYDPLATPEGRFAHSIVIPNPVPADSGYRRGMTSNEYFEHLCRSEAGNFIFKTVSNVEGITQLRKREVATDRELSHLYAMEDPYGYTYAEASRPHSIFVEKHRYAYFDSYKDSYSDSGPRIFDRYSLKDSPQREFKIESIVGKTSRYGYTWRGIHRPHDREMGIAGGEVIVIDLETSEVLGVRRGFIRSGGVRDAGGIWWLGGVVCPVYDLRGGRSKDFDFLYWFIGKVLQSRDHQMSFAELERGK